jgi:hypothetical protein
LAQTAILRFFNCATLRLFKDPSVPSYVKFGTIRDNDPTVDIQIGRVKISGKQMAEFFEPSIQAIANCIRHQQKAAGKPNVVKFAPLCPTDST